MRRALIPVILALSGCGAIDGASINVQAGKGPCGATFHGAEVVVTNLQFACRGGQLPSADAGSVVAAPTEGVAVPVAGSVARPAAPRIISPPSR